MAFLRFLNKKIILKASVLRMLSFICGYFRQCCAKAPDVFLYSVAFYVKQTTHCFLRLHKWKTENFFILGFSASIASKNCNFHKIIIRLSLFFFFFFFTLVVYTVNVRCRICVFCVERRKIDEKIFEIFDRMGVKTCSEKEKKIMWTCSNCGRENPSEALECTCGYRKVSTTELDEHSSDFSATKPRYSKSGASKFGIVVSSIGIAFGIALIIMALVLGGGDYGYAYVKSASFGADFYTDIYDAVRETFDPLNAIADSTEVAVTYLRWIVIGIGGGISLFSAMNLSRILTAEKRRQRQQSQMEELCALLRSQGK